MGLAGDFQTSLAARFALKTSPVICHNLIPLVNRPAVQGYRIEQLRGDIQRPAVIVIAMRRQSPHLIDQQNPGGNDIPVE